MPIRPGGAPLNCANGIREFARATPSTVAVLDGDRTLTFAALHERSNRLATGLLAAGLVPGDRVAVLLHNRAEYLEITAGLSKAGLVLVPLNPRSTPTEAEHVLGHAGVRAVLVEEAASGVLDGAALPELVFGLDGAPAPAYEDLLAGASAVDPCVAVAEADPFTIVYTSGTTGRPKGVVLSHRARTLTFYASALEWGLGLGGRSVAVAPMYHGAGLSYSYGALATGGSVTVLPKWDPEHFLHLVRRDRATTSFLVPTHAHMLRALADGTGAPLLAEATQSLRTLFFNAAALPVALKRWVLDTFPHVGVHELYGSTEAGAVANLRPADAARKAGSVGPPWLFTEVQLLDAEGVPVAPGQPGELHSRAPWLMSGYLHDDEATEACTTADGFVTAGDVAVADEEGYLTIVDRVKDMIVTGGVNVYPREIEELLAADPRVAEVAVVGLPHPKWGEAITAFVVPRSGCREDLARDLPALGEGLDGRLAAYKLPREWRLVEELPRSTAGKVLKRQLRLPAAEEAAT
ncbi:MAG TPA: AMP-binding protein [Mycobacteriales bacterium]|jgi:long-chain acyl-CoA synthetase|nr:AMP-binding protein [Mycobacteriales bacterium]